MKQSGWYDKVNARHLTRAPIKQEKKRNLLQKALWYLNHGEDFPPQDDSHIGFQWRTFSVKFMNRICAALTAASPRPSLLGNHFSELAAPQGCKNSTYVIKHHFLFSVTQSRSFSHFLYSGIRNNQTGALVWSMIFERLCISEPHIVHTDGAFTDHKS